MESPTERQAIAEAVQAVVRHDARNKVAAIRNAAYFLKKKAEKHEALWKEPRVADFFTLIEAQLKELEGVLGDQGPAAEPAPARAQVSVCVKAAVEAARLPRSMGVAVSVDDGAQVAMDAASLTIAVRALLDNAREAAGAQGHVAVVAKAAEEKVTVRVVDDGPGLPPERLAHPARPLERPRAGHAGLGLSVAWRLVRRAGGELTVKNQEKGTGAVVELTLPLAAAPEGGGSGP